VTEPAKATGAEPILEVRDIVVDYPGHPPVRAVDGVSFELYPGEVVGLVGESGCGKSTMARVITGLLKPTKGEVLYRGEPLPPLTARRRSPKYTGIQMVFQDPSSSLNPRRRVGSQVEDGLQAARARAAYETEEGGVAVGAGVKELTASQWLQRIGLSAQAAGRYPQSFSGGQRQRIATARALAARPSLLVGDEPISALDASTQARVAGLMCQLALEQGTSLLFISHDLSIVRLIADRIIVMYAGRVVERGRTDQVWNDPRHPYTKALLGAIPAPDGSGRMPVATPTGTVYPRDEISH
jgi:peptide/nickel transport system ATP-binding protein